MNTKENARIYPLPSLGGAQKNADDNAPPPYHDHTDIHIQDIFLGGIFQEIAPHPNPFLFLFTFNNKIPPVFFSTIVFFHKKKNQ
ncbi:hypothetical protein [Escherichia coli]|uniref:hypothetical protein n=1 Tax=Escherichia coli TaxID=562 RepID=UPI0030D3C078